MTFAEDWEHTYAKMDPARRTVWPWSDVVSLVHRHAPIGPGADRVLELGCGAGANLSFFQALGARYHGIDGSGSIIAALQEAYPALADRLAVADFTSDLTFKGPFDLVVDRGSLTHNPTHGIRRALELCWAALRPGGTLIAIDLMSIQHGASTRGEAGPDGRTRSGFTHGDFVGLGRVHFADEKLVRDLFADYEVCSLDHKRIERIHPPGQDAFASWNVVARRPEAP